MVEFRYFGTTQIKISFT